MARPAFTQTITYELDPPGPTQVAFQELLIEITEADNLGIEYTVSQVQQ